MPTRASRRVGKIVSQQCVRVRATILPALFRFARRLVHAAVWRHHIDRRGRDRSDPRRCDFDRHVVDIDIENRGVGFILIWIVGFSVHGSNLLFTGR